MKRFIQDLKKYFKYIIYATRAELKSEVANSYLNWIWWLLEPICFMLIYAFISIVVFKSKEPYFPIFVFIGLSAWTFFNQTVSTSVRIVSLNKSIVTKVYVPKFVLILVKMFKNFFKMLISFGLVFILMIIYKVPISIHVLNFIPLLLVLFIVTFGVSIMLLHFGVFIEDLTNIINIVLKLVFYLSGIFYMITTKVPAPYNDILLYINPLALIISSFREALLYSSNPYYLGLAVWLIIGLLLSYTGLRIVYKHENSYVKVIK